MAEGGWSRSVMRRASNALMTGVRKCSTAVHPSLGELSGFDALNFVQGVQVTLDSWEAVGRAIQCFVFNNSAPPVPFSLRDPADNAAIYSAAVLPHGFVVLQGGEQNTPLMTVSLSSRRGGSARGATPVAKVKNLHGIKLFTILQVSDNAMCVRKAGDDDSQPTAFLYVAKRQPLLRQLFACCGFTFDAAVYEVGNGGVAMATIKPQISWGDRRAYTVHFGADCEKASETRALIVAVALLLTLQVGFPELAEVVQQFKGSTAPISTVAE